MQFLLLVSRQGKPRLQKWYLTVPSRERTKIVREVTSIVLARRQRMCNVIEYKESKIVYKRYASLFFIAAIDPSENELITLEIIHRYVEVLDRYFGNVCELDLIFNYQKAYYMLDELIVAGEIMESSKRTLLRGVQLMDQIEQTEEEQSSTLTQLLNAAS